MTSSSVLPTKAPIHTAPIVAWKVAHSYIRLPNSPELEESNVMLYFHPITSSAWRYGVVDEAHCSPIWHRSAAPQASCTFSCGFNAWDATATALSFLEEKRRAIRTEARLREFGHWHSLSGHRDTPPSLVILRVALFGRVIEGILSAVEANKFGYRAEKQRVLDMFFEKRCECGDEAMCLAAIDANSQTYTSEHRLRPLCAAHSRDESHRVIDIDVIQRRSNVRIHWGYPSE